VHALLLERDGTLFLADAGSTNGTWCGKREVRCTAVTPRVVYGLGQIAGVSWEDS